MWFTLGFGFTFPLHDPLVLFWRCQRSLCCSINAACVVLVLLCRSQTYVPGSSIRRIRVFCAPCPYPHKCVLPQYLRPQTRPAINFERFWAVGGGGPSTGTARTTGVFLERYQVEAQLSTQSVQAIRGPQAALAIRSCFGPQEASYGDEDVG